jgi:hypothetical protein
MDNQPLTDPQDTQTVTADPKHQWEKPSFKEADIATITQTGGLGNNDGFISHT